MPAARRNASSSARPSTDAQPVEGGADVAEAHLRDLQALTDAQLAHLDVDDLLVELLDRVLVILGAETAAVLLRDERAEELVARAARGIEEEVRQGVRIPVGRGFAGRIAAEKRAVILDRVDETTVSNPLLWEAGIQVMLGVPLLAAGQVIGVLHVGRKERRPFSEHDADLLQVVADRVAGAARARQLETERSAARVLQRSLLPSTLPVVPGLQLAARYMPAGGGDLGGDWYDAFTLPSGRLWLVTGDVAGHGFRAAVVMGRLRTTIRAYALEERPPEEVLALADRELQHFEGEEMATVACAVASPPFDSVRLAVAGHPPPVLAPPGGPTALVDVGTGPPLGVVTGVERTSTIVSVPLGAVLVLYTDGLIERRTEPLDTGFARLLEAVAADHPQTVCRVTMERLVGATAPADDVAIVAIRRP